MNQPYCVLLGFCLWFKLTAPETIFEVTMGDFIGVHLCINLLGVKCGAIGQLRGLKVKRIITTIRPFKLGESREVLT